MEFLGVNLRKVSSLLLSPFYWRILKKTILFSGFKNPYFLAYVSYPIHPLSFLTSVLFLISHIFFTLLSLYLYFSPLFLYISICNPPLSLSASHLLTSSRSLFLLLLGLNLFSSSISSLICSARFSLCPFFKYLIWISYSYLRFSSFVPCISYPLPFPFLFMSFSSSSTTILCSSPYSWKHISHGGGRAMPCECLSSQEVTKTLRMEL